MLQRVRIRGYRMLRDVDVPLKPLTVLIGANDTGKSTFMRALQWIGRDLPWSGDLSWHRRRAPIAIDFEGQWEGRAGAFTKSSVPDTGNRITASRGDAAVLATARAAAQSAVIVELPREGPVMRGSAIADSQGAP
ncbi:MAG TPA: AAA family ATPase, partial [Planctomycetota bacterium]|nr:AAA family ATPase [Planctomycetota bacterium]